MPDLIIDDDARAILESRLLGLLNLPKGSEINTEYAEPTATHDFSQYQFLAKTPRVFIDDELSYEDADRREAVESGEASILDMFGGRLRVEDARRPTSSWAEFEGRMVEMIKELLIDHDPAKVKTSTAEEIHIFNDGIASPLSFALWNAMQRSRLANWVRNERLHMPIDDAVIQTLYAFLNDSLFERLVHDEDDGEYLDIVDFYATIYWNNESERLIDAINATISRSRSGGIPSSTALSFKELYGFEPFESGTVDLGIQLIYRQQWRQVGTQRGEVLRTIPLGPKQVEKVTIKAVTKTKRSSESTTSSSVETTTEASVATKDSSEIVREASNSFNWHVEATAEASFGFGGASVTAGAAGEEAASSKDTKSRLNEAMNKSSSKVKRETKVVISTETEETNEFTRSSEIVNPNDEIAITYVYSRQQSRYEINSFLAQANACLFVAEHIPTTDEINIDWVRRYDWIIARDLLDNSYQSDLSLLRTADVSTEDIDLKIGSLMGAASLKFGGDLFGSTDSPPDVYANPQLSYERELEKKRTREQSKKEFLLAGARVIKHIQDNILHYFRAIMSAEDPEARILRYRDVKVPVDWVCARSASGGFQSCHAIGAQFASVSDLIDPSGPIGFAGNYAVYYLRKTGRYPALEGAIDYMRLPYLLHIATAEPHTSGPAPRIEAYVGVGNLGYQKIKFIWNSAEAGFDVAIFEESTGEYMEVTAPPVHKDDDGIVSSHGVRIVISVSYVPADDDYFEVTLEPLPRFEDPELRKIRFDEGLLSEAAEEVFYSIKVINNHRRWFLEVSGSIDASKTNWSELTDDEKNVLRRRLADYILRDRHTREITVDTNNVILSLLVDNASTLEPFKATHRFVDVLSAYADTESKRIDNRRKEARIEASLLGDPDIEKVTVVSEGTIAGLIDTDP